MGGLLSLQPTVTAPSRLRAAWVLGGPFLRLSHLKRFWPGSREAGLQFCNWKNLGATEGWFGISTEGPGTIISVCPHRLALHHEGHLRGLLWAWAPDPHSLQCTLPPLCSEKAAAGAVRGHGLPAGKCVWDRQERGRVEGWPQQRVGFSCSQRGTEGHRYYCSAGQGGPGTRGARQDL